MTFDFSKIIESKKAYRARLRQLSIAEKLRILDALQERAMDLRRARGGVTRENPPKQPDAWTEG
jgi:hypothetical protein